MIIRENTIKIKDIESEFRLHKENMDYLPEELVFFDLEHYVYKKPKCIGVFGASEFDRKSATLKVTQYMIENRYEGIEILHLARNYFVDMESRGKKAIVTFSGNNDFTVINYLFEKYSIKYYFNEKFDSIDIQKEYESMLGKSIGLKNLEKIFGIIRESEVISGSNLAKTFHKVMKDKDYIKRMPEDKIEKILLYNEQDVVNLFHIYMNWSMYINKSLIEENKEEVNIKSIEDIEEVDSIEVEDVNEDIISNEEDSLDENNNNTVDSEENNLT